MFSQLPPIPTFPAPPNLASAPMVGFPNAVPPNFPSDPNITSPLQPPKGTSSTAKSGPTETSLSSSSLPSVAAPENSNSHLQPYFMSTCKPGESVAANAAPITSSSAPNIDFSAIKLPPLNMPAGINPPPMFPTMLPPPNFPPFSTAR